MPVSNELESDRAMVMNLESFGVAVLPTLRQRPPGWAGHCHWHWH